MLAPEGYKRRRIWELQVQATAELRVREAVDTQASFNFARYMKQRAELVNEALDRAVPLQYPEAITEAMRSAPVSASFALKA